MEYILATGNAHKAAELSALLGGLPIRTMREAGYAVEIEENGADFKENALIKARTLKGHIRVCSCGPQDVTVLADDSGLAVNALGGAPGVRSHRWAGEDATDAMRIEKLLRELDRTGSDDRSAKFVCCIACILPSGETFTVTGECRGVIAREPAGHDGFGYDPVFYLPERGLTFAELTADEKNAVSHRGNACRMLENELRRRGLR